MPWTPKQEKLFRAVEHGWEPPAASGIKISPKTAKKLLAHGKGRAAAQAKGLRKK